MKNSNIAFTIGRLEPLKVILIIHALVLIIMVHLVHGYSCLYSVPFNYQFSLFILNWIFSLYSHKFPLLKLLTQLHYKYD